MLNVKTRVLTSQTKLCPKYVNLGLTESQTVTKANRLWLGHTPKIETSWNVMTRAQKPDFFFRRNGRVHLNRRGRRLLAAEVCASALIAGGNTPCSEVVWRVLATHSIRQFPLHFSSPASPCAVTFNWSLMQEWTVGMVTARLLRHYLWQA